MNSNEKTKNNQVVVIGAGPAGLMAAYGAAINGAEVCLFEKNSLIGRKLGITGKGRCNITNAEPDIKKFVLAFGKNGRFLYSAFSNFFNKDICDLLESNGVPIKIERGDRVFPVSDKATDVTKTLEKIIKKAGVKLKTDTTIDGIEVSGNKKAVIYLDKDKNIRKYYCDSIIITTGGLSYPVTGSTGDGYDFAKTLGHSIEPLSPALIPFTSEDQWVHKLTGLSLKNVNATLFVNNKKADSLQGEMMFTHFGLTGPIILTLSNSYPKNPYGNEYVLIDLKPALTAEQLDKRLIRDFEEMHLKELKNGLDLLLPKSLIPVIIEKSNVNQYKKIAEITKEERQSLVNTIKNLKVNITGVRPIEEAIVTDGGVSLKEIDPKTMESKIIPGIYFAGEILDIRGVTGGFNLQSAWSTGYVAGCAASVVK